MLLQMAFKNDGNQDEWILWYEDLNRKLDNISLRISKTEIGNTGPHDDDRLWRELRLVLDTNTKLAADVDLLRQDVAQLREKNASLYKNMTSLQRDLTATQADHVTLCEDLETLQTENIKLRANVTMLQKDNGKLRQQVTSLEVHMQELLCDVTSVKNDVSARGGRFREVRNESRRNSSPATLNAENPNFRSEVEFLQRKSTELLEDMSKQRKDMDKLLQEVTSLRGKNGDLEANVSTFRCEAQTWIHNFKSQIASLEMFMSESSFCLNIM